MTKRKPGRGQAIVISPGAFDRPHKPKKAKVPSDGDQTMRVVMLEDWLKKNRKECMTDTERTVVDGMLSNPSLYLAMMDDGRLLK